MSDSVHALLVLRAISVQPIAHDVMHTTWITDVDCDRNVLMTMRYAEQALRRFLDLFRQIP